MGKKIQFRISLDCGLDVNWRSFLIGRNIKPSQIVCQGGMLTCVWWSRHLPQLLRYWLAWPCPTAECLPLALDSRFPLIYTLQGSGNISSNWLLVTYWDHGFNHGRHPREAAEPSHPWSASQTSTAYNSKGKPHRKQLKITTFYMNQCQKYSV